MNELDGINPNIKKPITVKGLAPYPKSITGILSNVYETSFMSFTIDVKTSGHVFFMDIDVPFSEDYYFTLHSAMKKYKLSHLLILTTRNGFHVICFDVQQFKAGYYELFTELKSYFKSDYEFSYKWILRLSPKGKEHDIKFKNMLFNSDVKNAYVSMNHFLIYMQCFDLPEVFMYTLLAMNKIKRGSVRTVKYLTWNYDFSLFQNNGAEKSNEEKIS